MQIICQKYACFIQQNQIILNLKMKNIKKYHKIS
jgi:hypothetical protein